MSLPGPRDRQLPSATGRHVDGEGAPQADPPRDLIFGLGRMYQACREQSERGTKQVGVFRTMDEALRWLRLNPRQPIFLWLHLYDPHYPYTPPEPFASRYRAHPYDGEIAFADAQVGRLFAFLRDAGIYDSSVIALMADHGEGRGRQRQLDRELVGLASKGEAPVADATRDIRGWCPRYRRRYPCVSRKERFCSERAFREPEKGWSNRTRQPSSCCVGSSRAAATKSWRRCCAIPM